MHTCPVAPLVACSMRGSPCVEPHCDFFFVLVFFCMGLLPPSWPCAILFFFLASFVPVCCAGTVLSCILVCPPGTVFGIVGILHSSGHSWTSIWMSCIVTQYFSCNHSLDGSLFSCSHILWRDAWKFAICANSWTVSVGILHISANLFWISVRYSMNMSLLSFFFLGSVVLRRDV
jgi:hypothetical protein